MLSRREFLEGFFAVLAILPATALTAAAANQLSYSKGLDVFERIMKNATASNLSVLPIGELMGKIAQEFEGTPYVANTLELSPDSEICSFNLTGLDCVTFFETTLDLARMLKKGGHTPDDLLKEISFTRYRAGKPGDYSTRLHYTTDWFADNESKHVVKLLSHLPGAMPFTQKVGLMSEHPESSIQLKAHPELISKIERSEKAINARSLKFIPMDKIAAVETLLKTGDIVGICSSTPGLDIMHTGLVFRSDDGVAHFMDATSKKAKMMVTIEPGPISQSLIRKNAIGAMFARPLEPVK